MLRRAVYASRGAKAAAAAAARAMSGGRELKPMDGNKAASIVAYKMSDGASIYPITPSSPMGEQADDMMNANIKNIYGEVPVIKMLQSEAGAAGALHGMLATGSLATTFTSSQGLLLMVPNMFKIAGELLPSVIHVAARALSYQALSIYGDHSDVMACRPTGFAMLCSSTVQEVMDFACVSHTSAVTSRVPFMHYFEGFRLSHEVSAIDELPDSILNEMQDHAAVARFRQRALMPEHPYILGHGMGPDANFQTMEAANSYYDSVPDTVQANFDKLAGLTGRQYKLFDYYGPPDATDVIVIQGAGGPVVQEAVRHLGKSGRKVGVIRVRLYRPWDAARFVAALPPSVQRIAVLDRTKESGAPGEPLFQDVAMTAQQEGLGVRVVGGRFGLSSKDFTPAMAIAVFDNLVADAPKNHFTVGISDDVTHTSLPVGAPVSTVPAGTTQALFWGMGSDGTVGANKSAIGLVVKQGKGYGQANFAYSADKSNAVTRSFVRFGPEPIYSHYNIYEANYIACHNHAFISKYPILATAAPGGTFVVNAPWHTAEEIDRGLPGKLKRIIAQRGLKLYVIDAAEIAARNNLKGKISQIMNAIFFNITGVLGAESEFVPLLEKTIAGEFKKLGEKVINANVQSVREAIGNLREVEIPESWADAPIEPDVRFENAPGYIHEVVLPTLGLAGGNIPVGAFKALCEGGVSPTGTTQYEKKGIADEVPIWDSDKCSQCNECAWVCPHAAIRPYLLTPEEDKQMASKLHKEFTTAKLRGAGLNKTTKQDTKGMRFRIQVSPMDCTSCGLCVAICNDEALSMVPMAEAKTNEHAAFMTMEGLASKQTQLKSAEDSVRVGQFSRPLLEFPASCAGCTETSVLKVVTQLFGERMVVANASGCSSVWGGAFPRNPWRKTDAGRGVAWGRSLFEDAAEYGYGMAVSTKHRRQGLLARVRTVLDAQAGSPTLPDGVRHVLSEWTTQFENGAATLELLPAIVQELSKSDDASLDTFKTPEAYDLWVKKSHWVVGGDGWAYDIGYSGLDHIMSTGEDLNVLIFDNEVYANTGAQMSKATPRGALAKFAGRGKAVGKKDLGSMLMRYDNVYFASIAFGSGKYLAQAQRAFREAESFPGPAAVIAYSNCVQHYIGKNMGGDGLTVQDLAVQSGYWPLCTWDPRRRAEGLGPFVLHSPEPDFDRLPEFIELQGRFKRLENIVEPAPLHLQWDAMKVDVKRRFLYYDHLAKLEAPPAQ